MSWSVYLLTDGTRTYVGCTTDVQRRLRQHNGELRGGARSTRGRKWRLHSYVEGFDGRSSACRWERIVKLRARGLRNRSAALESLSNGICPIYTANQKFYPVPKGLELYWGVYFGTIISNGSHR